MFFFVGVRRFKVYSQVNILVWFLSARHVLHNKVIYSFSSKLGTLCITYLLIYLHKTLRPIQNSRQYCRWHFQKDFIERTYDQMCQNDENVFLQMFSRAPVYHFDNVLLTLDITQIDITRCYMHDRDKMAGVSQKPFSLFLNCCILIQISLKCIPWSPFNTLRPRQNDRHLALQWHHNGRDSVSNHQPHDCFLNRLFRRRSKQTSKLRVTGLCARNSPGTGEFPAQMASNAENASIWWRHHAEMTFSNTCCWIKMYELRII